MVHQRQPYAMRRAVFLLIDKPQARLVEENSTSVDSVKEGPPFVMMKAGNATAHNKQKEVRSIWTRKVYHTRVKLQISYSVGAKISEKSNLQEATQRYWEDTENAL